MIQGIWGKKIGMTQVFNGDVVVPVTAVDVSGWLVTRIKTAEADGYRAVQVGKLRNRYAQSPFDAQWLKHPGRYFLFMREIRIGNDVELAIGSTLDVAAIMQAGIAVDVTGVTTGHGFQGGIKRHGFSGGRGSHGDKLGRKSGSLSFMRRQGRVIKGKRMPGRMGFVQQTMKNLQVVDVRAEDHVLLIKGSVPGRPGTLLYVDKQGN